MVETKDFKTGDLLEVKTKTGTFKCIFVEDYQGGFVSKVLEKTSEIGTGTWNRYGLEKDFRFQVTEECVEINKLAEAKVFTANSTFTLNESVSNQDLVFYETPVSEDLKYVFCVSENFGGWSVLKKETSSAESLKESFLGTQISKFLTEKETD